MVNSKTNSKNNVKCMDQIVGKDPQILILGSMPGKKSLTTGRYYDDPSNQFWDIIASIYNNGKPFKTYEEKIQCLKDNKIALWDIFECCERIGSSDKDIKNAIFNCIALFLKNHPTIIKVLCNGKKAWNAFKKLKCCLCLLNLLFNIKIEIYYVPSTSRQYCSMDLEEKIAEWRKALIGNNLKNNKKK